MDDTVQLREILDLMEVWAPSELAEPWDNTGLLIGSPTQPVKHVLTCLTITPSVVQEAQALQTHLVLTHHPVPFRPLQKITTSDYTGRLLWGLASHGIAVVSLHTRYDSAQHGINQQLAEMLTLRDVEPLEPVSAEQHAVGGRGRWGRLPRAMTAPAIANLLRQHLPIRHIKHVAALDRPIETVAIGCGSAGSLLPLAAQKQCDLLLLGETTFHTCLEAQAMGVDLMLAGHFLSEHFAQQTLGVRLQEHFPSLLINTAISEQDPIQWL
jgi:dinuclear metal center YbgI/SA1388 family protein